MNESQGSWSRAAEGAAAVGAAAGFFFLAGTADVASAGQTGSVTVTRTGSTVRVTGGDGNERIILEPGDAAGELRIRNGGSTSVNGGQETVIAVGKKDKVLVSLGGNGDNCVVQNALPKFKSLKVDMGDGDDQVSFASATLPGSASVYDVNGSNSFQVTKSLFQKNLLIAGGDGNDTISVNTTNVDKNLEIRSGGGVVNSLAISGTTVKGKTKLVGGSGYTGCDIDSTTCTKTVMFDGGDGDSYFGFFDSTASKNMKVRGLDGQNVIRVFDSDVNGPVQASLGEGADRADLVLARLKRPSTVNLGGGNDQATLGDVNFTAKFKLLAGDGDDTVFSNDTLGSTASKPVIFDGGKGTDIESGILGSTGGVRLTVKNFENTPD